MSDVPVPPPAEQPNQVPPPRPYDGGQPAAAIPGRTLGIVAFVLAFFFQLIAFVLGIVALVQSRRAGHKNGFALAAIIVSAVLGLFWIVGTLLFIAVLAPFGVSALEVIEQCQQQGYTGTAEVAGTLVDCSEFAPVN